MSRPAQRADPAPVPAPEPLRRSTRVGRQESKARTRRLLLEAARRVIARSGFHAASVEEIAGEAGFSTGAVYSNFEGKEDLFLALIDEVMGQLVALVERAAEIGPLPDRAQGGARQWMGFVEREPEMVMLLMEFWAFAVREPRVRPEVAARMADLRGHLAGLVERGARDFGLRLLLPAEQLALAIDALADGISRMKLADPDAVPDALLGDVVALLLQGATRPA